MNALAFVHRLFVSVSQHSHRPEPVYVGSERRGEYVTVHYFDAAR